MKKKLALATLAGIGLSISAPTAALASDLYAQPESVRDAAYTNSTTLVSVDPFANDNLNGWTVEEDSLALDSVSGFDFASVFAEDNQFIVMPVANHGGSGELTFTYEASKTIADEENGTSTKATRIVHGALNVTVREDIEPVNRIEWSGEVGDGPSITIPELPEEEVQAPVETPAVAPEESAPAPTPTEAPEAVSAPVSAPVSEEQVVEVKEQKEPQKAVQSSVEVQPAAVSSKPEIKVQSLEPVGDEFWQTPAKDEVTEDSAVASDGDAVIGGPVAADAQVLPEEFVATPVEDAVVEADATSMEAPEASEAMSHSGGESMIAQAFTVIGALALAAASALGFAVIRSQKSTAQEGQE